MAMSSVHCEKRMHHFLFFTASIEVEQMHSSQVGAISFQLSQTISESGLAIHEACQELSSPCSGFNYSPKACKLLRQREEQLNPTGDHWL